MGGAHPTGADAELAVLGSREPTRDLAGRTCPRRSAPRRPPLRDRRLRRVLATHADARTLVRRVAQGRPPCLGTLGAYARPRRRARDLHIAARQRLGRIRARRWRRSARRPRTLRSAGRPAEGCLARASRALQTTA